MQAALSFVDRGWKGARLCSLRLADNGIATEHLIKGKLGDAKQLIVPNSLITLSDMDRWLFPWITAWALLMSAFTRRVRWVLCDNERQLRRIEPWCKRLGLAAVLIRETGSDFELVAEGSVKPFEAVFQLKAI